MYKAGGTPGQVCEPLPLPNGFVSTQMSKLGPGGPVSCRV